jgi:hypothetical protein
VVFPRGCDSGAEWEERHFDSALQVWQEAMVSLRMTKVVEYGIGARSKLRRVWSSEIAVIFLVDQRCISVGDKEWHTTISKSLNEMPTSLCVINFTDMNCVHCSREP